MSKAPCVRCGWLLHVCGERVGMNFSADDLYELALVAPTSNGLANRILCALSLLDGERANKAQRFIYGPKEEG